MEIEFKKARRAKAKLRLALAGPSGAGKTYSALLIASGIVPLEKVAVIDTESGSADLYADLGGYSTLTINPPYSPKKYIDAIYAAEAAGFELVIIDSLSHAWSGEGGLLDQAGESGRQQVQRKQLGGMARNYAASQPAGRDHAAYATPCHCHYAKQDRVYTDRSKRKKTDTESRHGSDPA